MKWNVIAFIVVAALVMTAVYFSFHAKDQAPVPQAEPTSDNAAVTPPPVAPASDPLQVATRTQPATGAIKQCTKADGSVFYTNLVNCSDADTTPGLSVIEAPRRTAPSNRSGTNRSTTQSRTQQNRSNQQKDRCGRLALPGTDTAPSDIPRVCDWSWGRAREIERMLSAADNPAQSTWKGEYCERLTEIWDAGCRPKAADFCYEEICGWR